MAMLPELSKLRVAPVAGEAAWPILQTENVFILPGVPEFFQGKMTVIADYFLDSRPMVSGGGGDSLSRADHAARKAVSGTVGLMGCMHVSHDQPRLGLAPLREDRKNGSVFRQDIGTKWYRLFLDLCTKT